MAVGDPDLLQRQALVGQDAQQPLDLAARIDDRGLHGLGAPDDGAVLLQRRHRRDDGADRRFAGGLGVHGFLFAVSLLVDGPAAGQKAAAASEALTP